MSRDGMQILSVYSKEGSRYIECYDVVMGNIHLSNCWALTL